MGPHQHIGLRIEHQGGTAANRSWNQLDALKAAGFALHRDPLVSDQATGNQVFRIDQQRVAVGHAAVAVARLVHHGVVLAVAAGGDQAEHQAPLAGRLAAEMLRLGQAQIRQRCYGELGAAGGGGEARLVEHPPTHLEFPLAGIDAGHGVVAGHGAGDQLAHIHRILQAAPLDRLAAVEAVGQLGQELHFADQLAAAAGSAVQVGGAGLIEAHPVVARFHCRAVGRLETVEHRQQQGLAGGEAVEMAGVGLGGQVGDGVDAAEGAAGLGAVGVGAE